jgi:hypothetical protein
MIDREKVVRGLERCLKCGMSPTSSAEELKAYIDCEYTVGLYCGKDRLLFETLELLKKQEEGNKAKRVPAEYEGDARSSWWYVCGECHGRICDGDTYCKHCGCKIDWE